MLPRISLSNPLTTEPSTITVVCGPARSGKTRWAIDKALAAQSAIIVTPSPHGADGVNRTLTGASNGTSMVTALTFSALVDEVQRSGHAHTRPKTALNARLQHMLIADLLYQHLASRGSALAVSSGLVRTVQRCVNECRLAGIDAARLEHSAAAAAMQLPDSSFENRMGLFLPVLRLYEEFCSQNDIIDEADQLRLAADRLANGDAVCPYTAKAILFDAFDRFSALQRRVIEALTSISAAPEIGIMLCFDSARPLLFRSTERTLELLRAEFSVREVALPAAAGYETPDYLSRSLYAAHGSRSSPNANSTGRAPASSATVTLPVVRILSAPNRDMEAEMAARELVRIRQETRCRWSDLALVVRGADYPATIACVFDRFNIPVSSTLSLRVSDNPQVQMLLAILELFCSGWLRDDLIVCLKSLYSGVSRADADSFRAAAEEIAFEGGKSEWIENAVGLSGGSVAIELFLGQLAAIEQGLAEDGLPIAVRCARLLEIPKVLRFAEMAAAAAQEPARRAADERALQEVSAALSDLTRLAKLREHGSIGFREFRESVRKLFSEIGFVEPEPADAVQVIPPARAGDRSHSAIIVMGMNEAEFPRRVIENALIRDEERMALAGTGLMPSLPISVEYSDEERLLFYRTVTAPADQLILSYARSDLRRDLAPSFYLDDLEDACMGAHPVLRVDTTLAGTVPLQENAVDERERLLAAASRVFDPPASSNAESILEFKEAAARLERAALASPAAVRSALGSRRLPTSPSLPESAGPVVREPKQPLTVTELNTYMACPFRFLMESRVGLPAGRNEQYLHIKTGIVREAIRRYFVEGHRPNGRDEAYAELLKFAEAAMKEGAATFSHLEVTILRISLAADLRLAADRENTLFARFATKPEMFDLAFGSQAGSRTQQAPPLKLRCSAGGEDIEVSGVIDRMDVDTQGKVVLINYTGAPAPDYGSMARGEAIDIPLYMLAAERLFNRTAAVGCTDSLVQTGRTRLVRTQHVASSHFAPAPGLDDEAAVRALTREEYTALSETMQKAVERIVRRMLHADITPEPGAHCRDCGCASVCRTTVQRGHSGGVPA